MPDALQGASSKMPSNGSPFHQVPGCAASAASTCAACKPMRCNVSLIRSQRAASISSAVTSWFPSSSRCAVLPPGAAHASSSRSPSCGLRVCKACSSNGAASCAAASCTDTSPCANPGNCCTGHGFASRIPCAPSNCPVMPAGNRCSCKYCAGVIRRALTRRCMDGCRCPASAIARASCG